MPLPWSAAYVAHVIVGPLTYGLLSNCFWPLGQVKTQESGIESSFQTLLPSSSGAHKGSSPTEVGLPITLRGHGVAIVEMRSSTMCRLLGAALCKAITHTPLEFRLDSMAWTQV